VRQIAKFSKQSPFYYFSTGNASRLQISRIKPGHQTIGSSVLENFQKKNYEKCSYLKTGIKKKI